MSRPAEFDLAQQMLSRLRTTELHTVPGEHDTTDPTVTEYFNRFGKVSDNKGYYSFDHAGVHFVALINVLQFKPGGLGTLGAEQLAWLAADLKGRSASTPLVVFAHMPLWTIYEPWGWGTGDADQLMDQLRRFGEGSGPAPLKVSADQLSKMLGITSVSVVKRPRSLSLTDRTIA